MRSSNPPLSSTSLPQAPRDESAARLRRYTTTMAIRIACFLLMAFVTPYGWYTWVFAAGAIFLPYVAVVLANVGVRPQAPPAERPERALPAAAVRIETPGTVPATPTVIRIAEGRSAEKDRAP